MVRLFDFIEFLRKDKFGFEGKYLYSILHYYQPYYYILNNENFHTQQTWLFQNLGMYYYLV